MTGDVSELILANVKYLRRYARALHGSQQSGDTYVRLCLEALLQQRGEILATGDVKHQLFKIFHDVWQRLNFNDGDDLDGPSQLMTDFSVKARLEAIPARERQILLLTALENFSLREAGEIIGVSEAQAEALLAKAWLAVSDQISTSVLIIEDEPLIAEDVSNLVTDMGHTIVGMAADQTEAVALAKKMKPGLVLTDIDLGSGGSGLLAAQEILRSIDVPVIFITAHPEQLLTGERLEPTYLVTKPFEADALRVTISQALSLKKIDDISSDPQRRSSGASR
jgi:CheY-like chemotaxis protein/DNA-directed RNA polymerase specialized sigma24 family protein